MRTYDDTFSGQRIYPGKVRELAVFFVFDGIFRDCSGITSQKLRMGGREVKEEKGLTNNGSSNQDGLEEQALI